MSLGSRLPVILFVGVFLLLGAIFLFIVGSIFLEEQRQMKMVDISANEAQQWKVGDIGPGT